MVDGRMYFKIKELKTLNFSERKIAQQLQIDRSTVKKYVAMSDEDYLQYSLESKTRGRELDNYRDVIIKMLEEYHTIPASVIYDQLLEKNNDFTPSKRTVRLYVAGLRDELGIPTQTTLRQYEEVAELPAGFQSQVDMGVITMKDPYGTKVKVYIFAMVMGHSRYKYLYLQLKPFNGDDFVMAHDRAFRFFGGRTAQIVYDQDRVMTVSENQGNVIYTEVFEAYKAYAGFTVRLCRGYDPQSKGKIEAVVKFIKNNYLKYRKFESIGQLNSGALAWLERTANGQKHETTKMIPAIAFIEEAKKLHPVPTISVPPCPKEAIVRSTNVVHYKQNRYQVPRGTYRPGRKVRIEIDSGRISLIDPDTGSAIAEHDLIIDRIGVLARLKTGLERNRGTKNDEVKKRVIEAFSSSDMAAEYVSNVLHKYPRYNKEQLSGIKKLQEIYSLEQLHQAIAYCTERELYSVDEFRATLEYFNTDTQTLRVEKVALPARYSVIIADTRPLSEYDNVLLGGEAK
jgi:transposase